MAGKIVKLHPEEPERPALYQEIGANLQIETGSLSREALLALLETLQAQRNALDALEPKRRRSEAYEEWAELHEYLEDLLDEVLDALEA